MLSDDQFEAWLGCHEFPREGIDYIRAVRSSPPSRAVDNGVTSNVIGFFPSRKMGHTIQSESHTGERLLLLDLEYTDEVKEFWDQPLAVPIAGTRHDGRSYRANYTCDVLSLHATGASAIEVKPLEKLETLAAKRPTDWIRDNNSFIYRPAVAAFEKLGIKHEVRCSEDFNLVRAENIQLLLQTRAGTYLAPDITLQQRLIRLTRSARVLTLTDLISRANLIDASAVVWMIDNGLLCALISTSRLTDPASAWVGLSIDDLDVVADTIDRYDLPSPDRTLETSAPTGAQLLEIRRRQDAMAGGTNGAHSRTTLWRYRKALKQAANSPLALIPAYHRCGPRGSRLSEQHDDLIRTVLEEHYCCKGGTTVSSAYSIYVTVFRTSQSKGLVAKHESPVVEATFRSRLESLPPEHVARARGGNRLARAAAAPTDPTQRSLRPNRAFERAHVDHWLIDLFVAVRITSTFTYALRPWVSFLIDSATKALLALVISLGSPCRATCARLLRECIRRHGVLPELLMSDSGSEFRSNFIHACAADLGMELSRRPIAAGRWGADVERSFGAFKTAVLGGLPGFVMATADDRSVSRKFRSDQQATIPAHELHGHLQRFSDQWFNTFPGPSQTTCPALLLRDSLNTFSVSGNRFQLDDDFLLATSVPADRRTFRFDKARGLRLGTSYYVPRDGALGRGVTIDEVREDPEDLARIYAHSGNSWVPLFNSDIQSYSRMDPQRRLYSTLTRRCPPAVLKELGLDEREVLGGIILDIRDDLKNRKVAELSAPATPAPRGALDTDRYERPVRPMLVGD